MNKKKLVLSVVLSVVLVVVMLTAIYFITKEFTPNHDGTITVEVIGLDNEIVKSKEIEFKNGDKLISLVESNFNDFVIEDSEYGAYIVNIENIIKADDLYVYVAIYVNGEYASSGLDTLEFNDGDKITFKAESWAPTE